MYHAARIIAIDDTPEHLQKLESQIKQQGGACLSIKFEGIDSLPDGEIKGVRIIFMDINLIVGASPGASSRNFSINEAILNKLLHEDNGPYALVTWTSTTQHEELMTYLNERLDQNKRPFFSLSLDKNEYLNKPDDLMSALETLLKTSPQMAALLDWEIRVQNAVTQVLNDLLRLSAGRTPTETSGNIDNFMSKLAKAAHGKENALKDKLSAVNDALSPVLHDKISHICSETAPNALWDEAVTKIDDTTPLTDTQAGRINLALHISKHTEKVLPSDRGAIVLLPENWTTEDEFRKKFSSEKSDVLAEFKVTAPETVLHWIMVPCQAACDHAQQNKGTIPLYLGVIRKKTSKLPSSLYIWPNKPVPIFSDSDDQPYYIFVNPRYMLSMCKKDLDEISDTNVRTYSVWGRIRNQLMDHLGSHIHTYGQRLGIINLSD
ncbi:hypothetical protein [Micavibrio aeruginosavorus]|uniref:Response receiver domain-containing protein n=1 Tax=Micavibrio aeruginosavorus EPB TaxID=349215 RepID=M4VH53_9BACT|nr:hypothetical protein [Micavibrio aeruginosavorus]AGH97820.1 hypothetical protein A11S_1000 [Micavibrio aeruginosavorus EPB]